MSVEEFIEQFGPADLKVRGHVGQNSGKRADVQRRVQRHRHMMLAPFAARQSDMAPRLPGLNIPCAPQGFDEFRTSKVARKFHRHTLLRPGVPLGAEKLVADEMQADDRRNGAGVKMAVNGIPDPTPKFVEIVSLGKNRFAQRAGDETAFVCIFDDENKFAHAITPGDFRLVQHSPNTISFQRAKPPGEGRSIRWSDRDASPMSKRHRNGIFL